MFEVWFKVPLYKGIFNPLGWTGLLSVARRNPTRDRHPERVP